jgi:hypothetical protein
MFRFTIRDLLLAVAAFGLALGWYLERVQHAYTREQLQGIVDTLESAGVEIEVDRGHVYAVKDGSFEAYKSLSRHDPKTPTKMLGARSSPSTQKISTGDNWPAPLNRPQPEP